MSISGLGTVTDVVSEASASKPNALDKEAFLKLLVAQLKNQDPLNPADSTEFVAQLAQFSSLEQLTNVNENLEYLQLYQASINNAQAVGFIGKNIEANGNATQIKDGVADEIHFKLEQDAKSVFINIYDSAGGLVKTIKNGGLNAGDQVVKWNGTGDQGNILPDGSYTFNVLATDADDNPVNVTTYTTCRVTGVTFKGDTTYLIAGGREIAVGDVTRITEAEIEEEVENEQSEEEESEGQQGEGG